MKNFKQVNNMSSKSLCVYDKVAKLAFDKFKDLPKTGKPKEDEWTILSCIISESNEQLEVVALGTGTKCIGFDKMSKSGDILNDSHAEIVCRRAFLRYLYTNMLKNKNDLLTFDQTRKKFTLSKNVKFHFFTTHVPCGDAAIFTKQSSDEFGNVINEASLKSEHKNEEIQPATKKQKLDLDKTKDIFRTGAKCLETDTRQDLHLEGANYHITGVVRTKPGRGTPTLSMSCSDKLSKWCNLGIQGALLALLLEKPVFLSSFIIAGDTPYNKESLRRALFIRLGEVTNLLEPYKRKEVTIGQASLGFIHKKEANKSPCASSLIWIKGNSLDRQIEVAVDGRRQGVTKKQISELGALKISKKELFNYFMQVIKQYDIILDVKNLHKVSYGNMKKYSKDYQKKWTILKSKFHCWTEKNRNFLDFYTDLGF